MYLGYQRLGPISLENRDASDENDLDLEEAGRMVALNVILCQEKMIPQKNTLTIEGGLALNHP